MRLLSTQIRGRGGQRSLANFVRRLRWIIIGGIFTTVIGYLWIKESLLDFGSGERVAYDILLYAFVGSFVTWYALTWVSNRIGEGERAQQKASQEETYIASIVASSADAILSMDPEGRITSWNKGAEAIFGYKDEDVVGKDISVLVPKDLLRDGELERLANEIREKGYIKSFETERMTIKGRRIPV